MDDEKMERQEVNDLTPLEMYDAYKAGQFKSRGKE
jgi:hypothetical protein